MFWIDLAKVKRRLKVTAVVLVVVGSLVLVLHQCTSGAERTVRTVYAENTRSLPLLVAREKGYFGKAGLTLDAGVVANAAQKLDALMDGSLEVIPAVPFLSVLAAERTKPGMLKIFCVTLNTAAAGNDAILVRKNAQFSRPSDLRGQRVGISPGQSSVAFARLVFKQYLNPDTDLTFVEIALADHLAALDNREVSALFTFEPAISQGAKLGLTQVLVKSPLEKVLTDPLPMAVGVMAVPFLEQNPEMARQIVEVFSKAIDSIRKNEPEARAIAAKALKLNPQAAAEMGLNQFWKLDEIEREERQSLQKIVDTLYRAKLLDQDMSVRDLVLDFSKPPKAH